MKSFFAIFATLMTLSAFASGTSSLSIVLDQTEVERLANDLSQKGFNLMKIQDNYATRGVYPRCICSSYTFTFVKHQNGKAVEKAFGVSTQGHGTSLKVSISPAK